MGSTRQFDFIVGPETSTLPTVGTPSAEDDILTLGFADSHYVQGGQPVADIAALKAIDVTDRTDNDAVLVDAKNSFYKYDSGSAAAGDDDLIVQPTVGAGRWHKVGPIDTATGNLRVPGNLTVEGTTTTIESTTHVIVDPNITVNDGGNQATADGSVSGLTVEMSDATDARIGYDSSLASKFKCGESGSEKEILTEGHVQTITSVKTFDVETSNKEIATPVSNPSAGYRKKYFKADGKLYALNSSGTETLIGPQTSVESYSAKSADYVITDTDGITIIGMTTAGTDRTVTLPTAADNTNRVLTIKKVDSGTGKCTVDGEGAETIEGVTTFILCDHGDWVRIVCDGSAWHIIDKGIIPGKSYFYRTTTVGTEGTTNTKIKRFDTSVEAAGNSMTVADSAADGCSVTINCNGIYSFIYSDAFASGSMYCGLSLNATGELTTSILSVTTAKILGVVNPKDNSNGSAPLPLSVTRYFAAGDVVRPHTDGNANDNTNWLSWFKGVRVA